MTTKQKTNKKEQGKKPQTSPKAKAGSRVKASGLRLKGLSEADKDGTRTYTFGEVFCIASRGYYRCYPYLTVKNGRIVSGSLNYDEAPIKLNLRLTEANINKSLEILIGELNRHANHDEMVKSVIVTDF